MYGRGYGGMEKIEEEVKVVVDEKRAMLTTFYLHTQYFYLSFYAYLSYFFGQFRF